MTDLPVVRIHYRRPPDREDVFRQLLVHDGEDVKVTLARDVERERPVRVDGRVALEDGSDVVWFTFPGRWHDVGRFHLADGTFTGLYANVLTPPELEPGHVWRTTDLFLDVWVPPRGPPRSLDEDELRRAVGSGWIDRDTARRALRERDRLLTAARSGGWPPDVVRRWTLERARGVADGRSRNP